ncbi:DUF4391 domain-containing protein [Cellulosimicrobium cellulans]|nr:DUF4391 domain-containing protein [Cellulosimicrobium cellulans]
MVPKAKFYEHAAVGSRTRERFVAQVAHITWAFKLGPTTVGLAGSEGVPEIEVLEVALKPEAEDVSDEVLAAINRAIPAPLLIEVRSTGVSSQAPARQSAMRVRLTAALTKQRTAELVTTAWLPATTERIPLPAALDLPGLHAALLAPLMPHAVHPGESIAQSAERSAAIRRLEREVAALRRRVRNEKQFNRRAEANRLLRERIASLADLTGTT